MDRDAKIENVLDELTGRSYLCCKGPRRGETVTVMGREEDEDRFRLESERGPSWTISEECLRRIFGPAGKRKCDCRPVDSPALVAPGEALAEVKEAGVTSSPLETQRPETSEPFSCVRERVDIKNLPQGVPTVIFTEESAQGSLF